MINQPKKYKKFLATATTASLVASAIVPVTAGAAGFSDVADTNSHAEAINALVEAGIIKGYESGKFIPNAKLTRGHVVKMLGKWVEAQGKEIPADWNKVQRFDDVAVDAKDQELVKYAALVKEAGVFNGSNGDLNAADSITRENMALTLDRAYKVVFGKSLGELATSSDTITVTDLATAKEEAREVIQALRNLGISNVENFQPKETVTRGQFASFLNRTINASAKPVSANPTTVTGIKTLTATAVNQLTVTFDSPVTNTEVSQFAVTRGTTAITVNKIEWNADKTQAVLTVDTKFSDATYNLTVNGVSQEALTASVTTVREKVTSIEFLSDVLVFTGRTDSTLKAGKTYKEAVATFALYNQYDEDITEDVNEINLKDRNVKGIDIYGDEDDIKIEDGRLIVWVDEDEDDDATGSVEFTYEQNDYEIDVKHNVKLSDESEPAQVEIVGLYNPSDKALTVENLEDKKEFSILFKVKDQYGVEISAKFADDTKTKISTGDSTILEFVRDGLSVRVSDDDIFEIEDPDDGQAGVDGLHGGDGVEVVNVDGEYYFAIDIFAKDPKDVKGGENTVTFRAKATGEETSKTFNVADSDQPYSIELGLPDEIIAGGEDVKLPVSTYNKAGELITDVKILNEAVREGKIKIDFDGIAQGSYTFIEEKGKVFLKFKAVDNLTDEAEEYDIEVEVEPSGIEHTLAVRVEPNAYPKTITSYKELPYVFLGAEETVETKNLVIEDQYGRAYTKTSNGTAEGKDHTFYKISVTSSNEAVFKVSGSGDKFTVKSEGQRKGNATIKFKLEGFDVEGEPVEDTLDITFRAIEIEDFDSFKVKSDGILYGVIPDGGYIKDKQGKDIIDKAGIKIVGLIGKKEVEIPTGKENIYYVTTDSKYLKTDGKEVTADTETIEAAGILDNETDKCAADILVTINETGETIKHTLTLVREDAKVNKFSINEKAGVVGKKTLQEVNVEYSEIKDADKLTASKIFAELLEDGKYEIKDQYANNPISTDNGIVKFFDGTSDKISLTITEINSKNDKDIVSSNGTNEVRINLDDTTTENNQEGLTKGDSFKLTLSIDGKSQTVKVYLK